LLFNNADVIGSLDGIPTLVRDRANRSLLPGLTEQTREQLATLATRPSRTPGEEDQLAKLRDKLHGLEGMLDRLSRPADVTHQRAFYSRSALRAPAEDLGVELANLFTELRRLGEREHVPVSRPVEAG
jgi:hypothetical protein